MEPAETPTRDDSDASGVLDNVIKAYLDALESGGKPDQEELASLYPSLATDVMGLAHGEVGAGPGSGRADASRPTTTATPQPPRQPGEIFGDYEVLRHLGGGESDGLYLARQISHDRVVALKMVSTESAAVRARLEELGKAAPIEHPSLVGLYEVGEKNDGLFLSMEFVEGPLLDQVISRARREVGKHSDATSRRSYVIGVVGQVALLCEGLERAHASGIAHNNVRPSNIVFGKRSGQGRFVLGGFGLANGFDLSHAAPERISGESTDARSDVYGLGVTLYELLTLQLPFTGANDEEELRTAILTEPPPLPRQWNPGIDGGLEVTVLRALAKDPAQRYASAGEFGADLRRAMRPKASPRPRKRPSLLQELWSSVKRKRR